VTSVLMVLDVDGTISRVLRDHEYDEHRDDPGWARVLPLDEPVIHALDEQARRPGVEVAWLTSWASSNAELDWLANESPLRGRLSGALVPWVDWPRSGWRSRSLLAYVEQIQPQAVIWADDRAASGTARRVETRFGIPHLILRPQLHVGLTCEHVQRIRDFIDAHLE